MNVTAKLAKMTSKHAKAYPSNESQVCCYLKINLLSFYLTSSFAFCIYEYVIYLLNTKQFTT